MANAQAAHETAKEVPRRTTIDPDEVAKFGALAAEWWDPFGPFKPLHKFNPVRLGLIRDEVCRHFDRDRFARRPLEGLRLLDIGCGGGLVAEPMARLGAEVTAIDAAERNVKTAMAHAQASKLDIDYRATTVEALADTMLADEGEPPFDIVLNLEVVEHVADVGLFLEQSARLLAPGGLMGLATINKTVRSLLTAKIGAEYVLRWLPRGTHDWSKFIRPEDAEDALEDAGLTVTRRAGLRYLPVLDSWSVGDDMGVNYMLFARKPIGPA